MFRECPKCGHQIYTPNRTSKTRDELFRETIELRREIFELKDKLRVKRHKPRIKLLQFNADQPEQQQLRLRFR